MNTHPHYLYSDIVNSLKDTKANIQAMTGLLDGTIAYATDTDEFGTYSANLNTWTWLGAGSSISVQDEGVPLGTVSTFNFTGNNVTATVSGSVARVFVTGSSGGTTDGWNADVNTWTFLNADAPSYVVSVNANVTGTIGVGMKVQLTHQTSIKNFIITTMSITGSVSYLNLYGGTDYTLNVTGSITNPKYSQSKSPFGFSTDPNKWTVEVTDTADRSQASPTLNTWYNLGSLSISIPIGCWDVDYSVVIFAYKAAGFAGMGLFSTLSTANNSESDVDFTCVTAIVPTSAILQYYFNGCIRKKIINPSSKTTYYLNGKNNSTAADSLGFNNASHKLIIRARCAYL